jgi:hypothetical protein
VEYGGAKQKSILMIAHHLLIKIWKEDVQSSKCSSVQHLAPPVLGHSLRELGQGRVCGMRLRGAPRPDLINRPTLKIEKQKGANRARSIIELRASIIAGFIISLALHCLAISL